MKSSNVHAILSEVYRLLGDYKAADFTQASEYNGITPQLREALRALAREAQHYSSIVSRHPTDRRHSQAKSVGPAASRNEPTDLVSDIISMIRRSKRFDSNPSILQFAKDVGLRIEARPKESRERLAKRVAEAILLTSVSRRSEIIGQLAGEGDSQTQGWIDAIKNSRQ